MKFYARLTPGIVTDLGIPLELVLHQPRKATSGVVVKIWEKASYTDIDGRFVEEGGDDDLLLVLHGDVVADEESRARGRTKLTVSEVEHPPREGDTPLGVLKLKVEGDPRVHEAPIPSTAGELGGQNFEIGVTVEHGGAEVFRSTVTTFIRPALASARVQAKRIVGRDASGQPIRDEDETLQLAGHYATIGTASSDYDDGVLVVLGYGLVEEDGRVAPCGENGEPKDGELMLLRTHRDLLAYVTPELPAAAKQLGPSEISLRLCHEIHPDGSIRLERAHPQCRYDFAFLRLGETP